LRQPTKFNGTELKSEMEIQFGKNWENAWRFSFSDRFFRKIPVIFSASLRMRCSSGGFRPKSKFGVRQAKERSDTSRHGIKGLWRSLR